MPPTFPQRRVPWDAGVYSTDPSALALYWASLGRSRDQIYSDLLARRNAGGFASTISNQQIGQLASSSVVFASRFGDFPGMGENDRFQRSLIPRAGRDERGNSHIPNAYRFVVNVQFTNGDGEEIWRTVVLDQDRNLTAGEIRRLARSTAKDVYNRQGSRLPSSRTTWTAGEVDLITVERRT